MLFQSLSFVCCLILIFKERASERTRDEDELRTECARRHCFQLTRRTPKKHENVRVRFNECENANALPINDNSNTFANGQRNSRVFYIYIAARRVLL